MSSVEIEAVTKRYGDVLALRNVSLTLDDGEFFALLGPSGSGKTTLLRAIAGFVSPESGAIRIAGEDVSRIPTHRREIGMVFQNYALFPHMSVFDNVAFSLSVRGVPNSEIARRVSQILDLVQLAGYEARRPRQLSGGQQQRIALARALVSRPRVLLLDEPLGALDRNLRQQMQVELKQIQREVGITTVLVTHDQEEALTLSDRIAVFRDGEVVQTGTPDAVYDRPETVFAAQFLGAANFLRGTVAGREGQYLKVRIEDGREVLAPDRGAKDGANVKVLVRPEKISIAPGTERPIGVDPGTNLLPGRVLQAIYMGASTTFRIEFVELELLVSRQNSGALIHQPGAAVWLSWPADHCTVLCELPVDGVN